MSRRIKPKPKTGKSYFTKDHENAIVAYCQTEDIKERTVLYIEYIQPAFDEMVDKIIYTYKFNNLPNIDSLKDECKIWLITILDKYDPTRGSKAFSYFSVITKHWFLHKTKKTSKKNKQEICYEEINESSPNDLKTVSVTNDYLEKRIECEYWNELVTQLEKWSNGNLKENEKKLLEAIKILMENIENIEIFNKKAIYLYLREITGLNTKQVVNNLNKIRSKYTIYRSKWIRDEI
mgnify:CR=1 FL=1